MKFCPAYSFLFHRKFSCVIIYMEQWRDNIKSSQFINLWNNSGIFSAATCNSINLTSASFVVIVSPRTFLSKSPIYLAFHVQFRGTKKNVTKRPPLFIFTPSPCQTIPRLQNSKTVFLRFNRFRRHVATVVAPWVRQALLGEAILRLWVPRSRHVQGSLGVYRLWCVCTRIRPNSTLGWYRRYTLAWYRIFKPSAGRPGIFWLKFTLRQGNSSAWNSFTCNVRTCVKRCNSPGGPLFFVNRAQRIEQ